ncbi:MAG: CBS domain-containing protein [Chloroflexi bacterium]|nr:CBS domain-containing protein [Chloroflexota bacterium]
MMVCPVCGFENMQGADNCENCGGDLRTTDIPHPGTRFEAELVSEPLRALDPEPPLSLAAETPVGEAIRTMQERQVDAVLVLEGERLGGIFTERDALLKLAGRTLDGVTLAEVMTRDPVVLRADDNMAVAIHKMASGRFRHIPVVEGGRASGIVTSRDLLGHLIRLLDQPSS